MASTVTLLPYSSGSPARRRLIRTRRPPPSVTVSDWCLGQLFEYFPICLQQSQTAGFHHRQGNRRGRVALSEFRRRRTNRHYVFGKVPSRSKLMANNKRTY